MKGAYSIGNKFLDTSEIIEWLNKPGDKLVFSNIPRGKKENMAFLIETTGAKQRLVDDCGAWAPKPKSVLHQY